MDNEIDPAKEDWASSMYQPKLGPLAAEAIFGPLIYMTFAITSLKVMALAGLWMFAFLVLSVANMSPTSAVRYWRNMVFGGDRPCRSYNRVRTRHLGEME